MRNTMYCSASVVAAAAALLTVGFPTVAHARTQKELSICWVNKTPHPVQDLEIVADGPSYKTAALDAGDCAAWDVRPGQYKITVEDVDDFLAAANKHHHCESLNTRSLRWRPDLTISIKRQREVYRVYPQTIVTNGEVTTDVKNDRRTSVTFLLKCISEEVNP